MEQLYVPDVDRVSRAAALYAKFLQELDLYNVEEYPEMADTPMRVATMLLEMTTPIPFKMSQFDLPTGGNGLVDAGIVLEKDINFASLCSHHMLPFYGIAHVAYIPDKSIVGLSKIARTVEYCSKALQTQELMGLKIAEMLLDELMPIGVAVILKATHTCMTCRGVKTPGATTVTSSIHGAFFDDSRARLELMELLKV